MHSNVDCIILAAGLSSRMFDFKPLMLYNGISFLENIINKTKNFCNKVIVVTGYNSKLIESIIQTKYNNEKIYTVFNPEYNSSMYLSLLAGLKQVTNNNHVLYHFIDQPTIPVQFYSEFLAEIDTTSLIVQPRNCNKRGHPLLFSFNFCKHLLNSNPDSYLKLEMKKFENEIKYWDCNYMQILKDFDTPEDYKIIED
jgi:molybdenum cofactor cytidylyltransferase